MFRIAIVEDERSCQKQLIQYIHNYEKESNERFDICLFLDGEQIVHKYTANYDIIFMDIQMKNMDGMTTAQKIRKLDENVILIFITNMSQFAIQGYAVNALDYVLKPISYFAFSQELEKAIKKLKANTDQYLTIVQEKGILRIQTNQISYIESEGHNITVHANGDSYTFRSSMKAMETKLAGTEFIRCNNCYLVNLRHVKGVLQNMIHIDGEELQISRPRKKVFMEALTDYLGGK